MERGWWLEVVNAAGDRGVSILFYTAKCHPLGRGMIYETTCIEVLVAVIRNRILHL